jgi:hypothetical protein
MTLGEDERTKGRAVTDFVFALDLLLAFASFCICVLGDDVPIDRHTTKPSTQMKCSDDRGDDERLPSLLSYICCWRFDCRRGLTPS